MSSESQSDFIENECQNYCLKVADGTHDSPKQSVKGKRLITSKNIKDGRLTLENGYLISDEDFIEINKRSKVDQWDILISMIGTVGEVCLVEDPAPDFAIKNVGLLKCGDRLRAKWLYYYLRSPAVQALIENRKKGSTQQYISLGEIRRLPTAYPVDPRTMQDVVDLLSNLDDRITLLRETNTLLEQIAQTIFKSWFVSFDPVRAKQEGRIPEGMDEETAALFPDSFEEPDLGMVPRGWKVGCVSDLARQQKGSVNPLASPQTIFEHYSLPAFDAGQTPIIEAGAAIKSNKTPLPAEVVLLSKLNPHIPRVWLPVEHGSNALCSTEFLAYSPSAGSSKEFIYCLFSSPNFLLQMGQLVTGTSNSHQRVKPDQIASIPVVTPSSSVLSAFKEISQPVFKRLFENRQQVGILADLRDTLLPRLISGKLRLPEAEAMLSSTNAASPEPVN